MKPWLPLYSRANSKKGIFMKGYILAISAVVSFAAQAQRAEVASCRSTDQTRVVSYYNDGTITSTVLNGVAIGGKPEVIKTGVEHGAITHAQLGLAPDANETLFQYPLVNGQVMVIAWSVDPKMPDFMTEGFQPKVLRMSLYSSISPNAKEIARYTGCRNL